jgi:hypothetical protein
MTTTTRKPRRTLWTTGSAAACLVAFALAGCSDNGPDPYDPDAASAAAQGVVDDIEGNPALLSLSIMGDALPSFAATPLAATLPATPPAPGDAENWLAQRQQALTDWMPYEGERFEVVFPQDVLGKTFVYDSVTAMYVVDDTATGAPAAGIRVILYAVDPILEQIIFPLTPVGHLDLEDVSDASADALQITAVVQGTTVLDYLASAVVTTGGVTLSAVGELTDGSTVVTFNLSSSYSETTGFSLNWSITAPDGGVLLVASADPAAETFELTMTLTHSGNSLVLDVTIDATGISGEIRHNTELIALITQDLEGGIVFTDPAGNPIEGAELIALAVIFEAAGDVLDHFEDLLEPAFAILQIPVFAL